MSVILRPIISEKSMNLTKADFYTFEVGKYATKTKILKIIKDKFKVEVLSVKMINTAKKKKMQRSRRGYFVVPSFKKAIVKIKSGQKIPLFESLSKEEKEVEVKHPEGEEKMEVKEKRNLLKGTKVKIETSGKSLESREKQQKKTDPKRPTKRSQKERKKV